ncbi:MAG: HNH endonuclease [Verrucomicrobiales bacterium]|nr:HNH endonuclease [Verrucomicrobiales bacterium]
MADVLDRQVLVLNRLWQPVNLCTARRAFSLLFLGHAQAVHTDPDRLFETHDAHSWLRISHQHDGPDIVHTVSTRFRIPAIIVVPRFDRLPRQEVKFSRQNVFERDNFTCQYCAVRFEIRQLNLDHVIPRHKGGKTTWENVVCSCVRCNTRKANKLPSEANMHPIREPKPPRWRPLLATSNPTVSQSYHESWRHFIEPNPAQVVLSR